LQLRLQLVWACVTQAASHVPAEQLRPHVPETPATQVASQVGVQVWPPQAAVVATASTQAWSQVV
jgi:hypothetical protein